MDTSSPINNGSDSAWRQMFPCTVRLHAARMTTSRRGTLEGVPVVNPATTQLIRGRCNSEITEIAPARAVSVWISRGALPKAYNVIPVSTQSNSVAVMPAANASAPFVRRLKQTIWVMLWAPSVISSNATDAGKFCGPILKMHRWKNGRTNAITADLVSDYSLHTW